MAKNKIFLLGGIFISLLLSTIVAYELLALWFTNMASVLSSSEAPSESLQIVGIALVFTQAFGAIFLSRMFIANQKWSGTFACSPVFLTVFAALTVVLIALSHCIAAVR